VPLAFGAINLMSDGTVSPAAPFERLSTPGIATLLRQLLDGTPNVPPGLLYSIARALGDVEAPPFDSPDAFLKSLARFERGERQEVVAGLVSRFEAASEGDDEAGGRRERRKMPSVVTHLRQELRAVDRRRYEEGREVRVVVSELPPAAPAGPRKKRFFSLTIGFVCAAGLACFAVANASDVPPATSQAAPAMVPAVATENPATVAPAAGMEPEAGTPTTVVSRPVRYESAGPARSTPTAKSPASPQQASPSLRARPMAAAAPVKKPSHRRILLRFRFARHIIAIRNNL
jgi:hypothetical protein